MSNLNKKIILLLIVATVMGALFTNGFSSIVQGAQLDEGNALSPTSEAELEKGAKEYMKEMVETTFSPDTERGKKAESTKTTAQQTANQDTDASCAWWKMLRDPLSALSRCVIAPLIEKLARVFAELIKWTLNMNAQLFTGNAYINEGWEATRDIANLGFVLAIIVIAFATILRIEAYGVKKTLARLIIVALLVNFSLMICAAFFSFSKILTQFFLNEVFEGDPGANLSKALGLTGNKTLGFGAKLGEAGKEAVGAIAGVILLIIVLVTLATISIMLLIRYVVLGILIILSPLAWLCSILPHTKKWWDQWWNQFLRWIIFAPAMLFFVWLALFSPTNLTNVPSNTGVMEGIGNLFIMAGLLLGGLIIANGLSLAGATAVIAGTTAGAAGVGLWASRGGARMAGGIAMRRPTRPSLRWAQSPRAPVRFAGMAIERGIARTARFGGGVPRPPRPGEKPQKPAPTGLIDVISNRMSYFSGKKRKKIYSKI